MKEVKKILLVDDDIDILEQNKLMLEAEGFEVFLATNTAEGIRKFEEVLPDAVVLDLMMDQYDSGFILSHKIKRSEHGKKIPVFMITSVANVTGFKFDASTDDEREWLDVEEILNKPVQVPELIAKIKAFYGKAH
ncbi:MAG: response regulator transcription factor [Ignavibacteriaceae bacterium]|nr:response regulator transcription factor [Ignavibacteriaceae bacterium]